MTQDKENAETLDTRSEEQLESFQRGHDGMIASPPMATGPSYRLMLDDQELGNFRLESSVQGGVGTPPKDLKKLKGAKDGEVVITGIFTPNYGGEDIVRGGVSNRSGADFDLEPNADGDPKISGHFRVNRMDHCGGVGADRGYVVVLESAEKEAASEKKD